MNLGEGKSDRKLLLILTGIMVVLIAGVSILSPTAADKDPRPTSYNAAPGGAKAAYLILEDLAHSQGRSISRWKQPLHELSNLQADRTTLILAEPRYAATDRNTFAADIKSFLEHGGRVLTTDSAGALLLPGGAVKPRGMLRGGLCESTPEGPGALARSGQVEFDEHDQWDGEGPQYRVQQRCGAEAVVVSYAVGKGEALWWTSASPLSNSGLKHDANLRLLLASVGEGRDVVFDESLHEEIIPSLWDTAKGLPLGWLSLQAIALFVLLVLSFSRRRGPLRMPVTLPRSSPVEFAESMGDLYEKGRATSAATEAARRRLLRVLTREAGVSQAAVQQGPEAIAEALQTRLGNEVKTLAAAIAAHLRDAEDVRRTSISAHSALTLVQALNGDAEAVRAKLRVGERAIA
jgi:hypothetical protein